MKRIVNKKPNSVNPRDTNNLPEGNFYRVSYGETAKSQTSPTGPSSRAEGDGLSKDKLNREKFGEWLFKTRKRAELTQEELAKAARCEKAYISKLETVARHSETRAKPTPTLEQLYDITQALKVPITDALAAYGLIKEEEEVSSGERELLFHYRRLAEDDKRIAEAQVAAIWHTRYKPRLIDAAATSPRKKPKPNG